MISIHALREEGDPFAPSTDTVDFTFQSTPSARRATDKASPVVRMPLISIHALREEGDLCIGGAVFDGVQFQSTPSARRATQAAPA